MTIWLALFSATSVLFLLNTIRSLKYGQREILGTKNPSVSIIIPCHGRSELFQSCLSSWSKQVYAGTAEFIFSFQDKTEPSIKLIENYKRSDFKILINERLSDLSGKGSNLFYGFESSKNEIIVLSDADIIVDANYLTKIVNLVSNKKDIVSSLVIHTESVGIFASIYAYVWNIVLVCIWAPGVIDNRTPGAAGGILAFDRKLLEEIGGIKAFAGYLAEDLKFGAIVVEKGGKVILGPLAKSPVGSLSYSQLLDNLKRAHLIGLHYSKLSRFLTYVGTTFAYGYVILLPLTLVNIAFLKYFFLFCLVRGIFLSTLKSLLERKFILDLSFLLGDQLFFYTFILALFKNKVRWGGIEHSIGPEAKII